MKDFLLVAEHPGPVQTLKALAASAPERSIVFAFGKSKEDPSSQIKMLEPAAVILGTSETMSEPNMEHEYGRAATRAGLPVFYLEDFPLNFQPQKDISVSGLFVEFPRSAGRYQNRGSVANKIFEWGNPRYACLSSMALQPPISRLTTSKSIFWAGQPDEGISYETLKRLLPEFKQMGLGVYFRAHPRDSWYEKGAYQKIFVQKKVPYVDITNEPSGLPWLKISDLVVTQFSTVAVEGIYLGIPAVFVLYPNLGSACMKRFKGHDWLPWAEQGMAFMISNESETGAILRSAISDENTRQSMINRAKKTLEYNIQSGLKIWKTVDDLLTDRRVQK